MTRTIRLFCALVTTSSVIAAVAAQEQPSPALEPIVKGAPYSAEAITTVKLTMFDGNRIERTVTMKSYRDREGRLRLEQTVMGLEALDPATDVRAIVMIIDPVSDSMFTLIPGSTTAQRLSLSKVRNAAPTLPTPPSFGTSREESLGRGDIEGIPAIGHRTITTIPASRVGNDKPIEIIDERWESTDLKVLLRSTHHDPRSGDVEYRLTNISRAEPPKSLFVVPPGYKIMDIPPIRGKQWP